MDWDILTKPHWDHFSYTRTDDDFAEHYIETGLFRVDSGLLKVNSTKVSYQTYYSLYSNTDNVYTPSCIGGTFYRTLEACQNNVQNTDWRVKSSSLNTLYYNPEVRYSTWVKGDGSILPIANFSSLKSNPEPSSNGYGIQRNLDGFIYHVWTDSHGFSDSQPNRKSLNKTRGANQLVDWWDEHKRYTVNGSSITVELVTYTGKIETIGSATILGGSGSHVELGGKTIQETKQNIANWYQYFRRRSFVTKSAIAKVITENPSYRYGLNFINNTTFPYKNSTTRFIEMPAKKGSQAHNKEVISSLFRLKWPARSTPLRKGLDRAGRYFDNIDGKKDPILESCQKNFTILFTDGYWNGDKPSTSIGDKDGDGKSVTLADITRYYYTRDLSPLNKKQVMTTFTVAFGLKGKLKDTDADGWPNPVLTSSSNWGDPKGDTDKPEKIDDLWHAAFNSDGEFVSAETPEEVANALSDALDEIGNRMGSASSASFSTTTLSADSAVFLAQFDTSNSQWSGD
ncbi:MAG: hypothetical protein KAG45_04925, partial [Methyloprofundus sp.]|nr:hypothetical protein [Methyloprofundus sp.]